MAYILGRSTFRDIELAIDERVLIPRRETGLLVEVAAELPEGARVHEVGTGSGAVALALLSERPDLRVTASDLSPEAVESARENAERLGLPLEVTVAEGLPDSLDGEVDLVLANLPYVTEVTIDERSPEIKAEPTIAVTGACGEDGLGVIRGLIEQTPVGPANGDGARHPPRPDDAGTAERCDYDRGLHGRRAGNCRHCAMSAVSSVKQRDE